jgi:hypothetical protein
MNGTQSRGVHEGQLVKVDDNECAGGSNQKLGETLAGRDIKLSPEREDATSIEIVRSHAK